MVFIYALELQQGKYYVGKTENPQFRMERHFDSNGSVWTKKYKPVCLVELIPNCDDYDEDKYTRMYMDKYGIDNVRGGSYISVELETSKKEYLEKTTHKCCKCGINGHFAEQCYQVQPDLWIQRQSVDANGNKRFSRELKPVTKEPDLLHFEDIPKTTAQMEYTEIKDEIADEIEKVKTKLLELETAKKEKEEREKAKKQSTFEYYLSKLGDFIQMKKEREINRNTKTNWSSTEGMRVKAVKAQNEELVPALEHIYGSLDIIHKKICILEEKTKHLS